MSSNKVCGRLEGKVAIVTGGASGIGARAVELFSEQGAKVVIGDIQDERGRGLAEKLGDRVCYIHCDVSKEDEMKEVVDATIAKFGQLDIMYSNAGILGSLEGSSIAELQKSEVERLLGVNLVGSFMAAKHAARAMIPSKKGSIIFTASACTQIAGLASHSYAASKHGIVGLMKSLAVEMGVHGIRVNCVSPFGVLTGIDNGGADYERKKGMFEKIMGEAANLKGRCLEAEDIAMAALYLASDEASYVSGLNLVVDGGFSVVNPSLIMAQQGCSRRV